MLDRTLIDAYLAHLSTERRLSPHTSSNYSRDLRALADFAERGDLDW
ncbi:MAG: site-specific integrase, partial [Steroidobacteraceae bacterium]|nr:site-specific integrase [Steroidobacteraceae bacterium]